MKLFAPLALSIAILFSALSCIPTALAEKTIDELMPSWQLLQELEIWERDPGPSTDADDKRSWHGCMYGDDINKETAYAELHRANSLARSSHFNEAIEQLSDAITRQPLEYRWRLTRAKLFLKEGVVARAKDDLRIAAYRGSLSWTVGFEIERLLVKLGEYQVAIETIPNYLAQVPKSIPSSTGAFQYLLGYCYEHVGQSENAIENYSQAAKCFMTERAFGAGSACLHRIKVSVGNRSKPKVLYELSGLEAALTAAPELAKMVKELRNSPNCFNPAFIAKIARAKIKEFGHGSYHSVSRKCLDASAVSPLTGIAGIELVKISGKRNYLRITLAPTDCVLHVSDVRRIIEGCLPVKGYEKWGPFGESSKGYKVPSGTLILCFQPQDPSIIVCILVVSAETEEERLAEARLVKENNRSGVDYYIASGNVTKALAATAQCLKEKPDDATAHRRRAEALALAGRFEEAITSINFVINDPRSVNDKLSLVNSVRGNYPLILKGTYQTALGKYAQALKTFEDAFPKTLETDDYYYRARAEIGLGRLTDGCADLEIAAKQYFNEARIVRRDAVEKLLQTIKQANNN